MVTALYRRYRPETFAEMIGQSQVTEPLMTALRTDRVNHAYLFSGPRGCGKTTSARILARCLNCAEGPTDAPCGVCPSCVELSRGGGGSLDVVEIDAASHGGVDDARDLRERAIFAPARDRYKIFIIDEAHMVTSGGFNALLKIVEEPPEHIKFIFATTEPDKVLGTIRSRTHHYPFRLVPPAPMLEYVQQLCTEEGISVEPGVLALVVRAGGGSPRDTLSLLDQLIAGSEGSTIDYERAVALLGYTHGALLDEVIDAIGTHDAAGAFAAADRVVQTGQDPRRFVEDLLERLRDLIVVAASTPEAAAAVLRGVPEDELARMATQARAFGSAELSRVADLVSQTLTEMTGATSPRLHLELMLARVLVPASDDSERGALARVERLERAVEGGALAVASAGASPGGAVPAAARTAESAPRAAATRDATPAPSRQAEPTAAPTPAADPVAGPRPSEPVTPTASAPVEPAPVVPAPVAEAPAAPAERVRPSGPITVQQVRDAWPEVLNVLQRTKRTAWMAALAAQVLEYRTEEAVLVLGFASPGDLDGLRAGSGTQTAADLLRTAIAEVLGVTVKFVPRVIGGGGGGQTAPAPTSSPAPGGGGAAASPPTSTGPDGARPSDGAAPVPPRADAAVNDRGAAPDRSAEPSATSAPAPTAAAQGPAAETPTGPVDSWATVAIPRDPEPETDPAGTAAAEASARTATALAERPAPDAEPRAARPAATGDSGPNHGIPDFVPDDAEAPPADEEPPFDPGPAPEPFDAPPPPADSGRGPAQRRSAPARRAPSRPVASTTDGGIQRYGEAVVREVLGATFLEEVEAPARGFGERG
ncbi:DNA polymerase III subunit gamma and tau [Agromyces sp. NPDC058126]|uniref:DNA polymerase III subunit gamma and tau n=1 Tax=Agromyces sp. NPDC058126 TaxID=3346350 RepID=UPI0036D7BE51